MSERILIVRLGALGDVANCMAAVAGLRRALPDAELTWLVEEGAAGIVEIDQDVDDVIVLPRRDMSRALKRPWRWPRLCALLWSNVRELRTRGFTRVLDFQGHLKSGLLSCSTGCEWRAGFVEGHSKEGNHRFQTVRVELPDGPLPRRERALRMVRAVSPDAEPLPPNLRVGTVSMDIVHGFMNRLPSGPVVAIHPGASEFGAFKRWPPERFGEVARALSSEFQATCVVTHGPEESRESLAKVLRASGGKARLAPFFTVAQLAGFLRESDLFVGADSGPLHVAALVGTKTVAVFGPKDPRVYAPPTSTVVRKTDLECSPCDRRSCRDPRCLLELSTDPVIAACREALS